jgi:diadenosine tetraphosphate (Ap4A) HIT family hydrolase
MFTNSLKTIMHVHMHIDGFYNWDTALKKVLPSWRILTQVLSDRSATVTPVKCEYEMV